MGEKIWPAESAGHLGGDFAEHERVVVDHDRGQEVQAGGPYSLAIAASVTDLALSIDAQGALQRVVGLTFVQAELLPALQGCVDQPGENEGTRSPPLVMLQAGWRGAADLCGRGPGGR